MRRLAYDRNWLAGKRRFIFVAVVAVLGFLLFSFGGLALSGYRLNGQADAMRQEIATLKAENEALQSEVRYFESDQGLEKLAREQLGWLKPGDTGVITIPSKTDEGEKPAALPAHPRGIPNWQRWRDLFFGG